MTEDLFKEIAPANALGIEIAEWADGRVVLTAPLAPNLNDKGTAFAGSIASMLSLAGWSAITLALQARGVNAEVMIVTSETRYLAAVRGELRAETTLATEEVDRLCRELRERGRGRVALNCALLGFAEMKASYAVLARS